MDVAQMEMKVSAEHLRQRLSRNSFARWMALTLVSAEPGRVALTAPWRDEFISNPDHGFAHGGILTSMLDTGGSYAVATLTGQPAQTIDMRVDFMRPALSGEFVVEAHVVRLGATLAITDASIRIVGQKTLAIARMTFVVRERSTGRLKA